MLRILFLLMLAASCTRRSSDMERLQARIDSLQKELENTYKPGFGEIMTGVQAHHAKLWFAGLNNNWALANFEVQEIQEGLEDIRTYCRDRPETKSVTMIYGVLDSMAASIEHKNPEQFKNSYYLLTEKCNNCHKNTAHVFNVVTVPSLPPVTNQDFKPAE